MKKDAFERIENRLVPDDELIRSVMDKAGQMADSPEMQDAYLKQHDDAAMVSAKKYAAVISAAAALLLVFGAIAFVNINIGGIKTGEVVSSRPEVNDTVISAQQDSMQDSSESLADTSSLQETVAVSEAESIAAVTTVSEAEKPKETTATEIGPDPEPPTDDDGRAEWFPEPGFDYPAAFDDGDGTGLAAVHASPTDEYIEFELDGVIYHFACGNYGEIYENYIGGRNIPNSSYIGEYLTNVDIPSLYGDIRPNASAEIYSLKYADTDFMLAARFPDFNNDPRYYLFASPDKTCATFAELMTALNIDKYTFNGQAVSMYNGMTKYTDDDSELVQMLLSADGELTDTAYGEAAWKIYIDAPIYGASVSFTCYSDGYIAANVFGRETVYNVGTDSTSQITSYINENSHE